MQPETVNWMRTAPRSAGCGGCANESHAVLLTGMKHTTKVAVIRAIQAKHRANMKGAVWNEAPKVLQNRDLPPG